MEIWDLDTCRAYVSGLGVGNSVPVTSGVPFTVTLSLPDEARGNMGFSAGVFSKWDENEARRQSIVQLMTRIHAFHKDSSGGYRMHIEYMN